MPWPKTAKTDKAAGISSAAVKKATGKDWSQWFALLDNAGARRIPHKEIATLLYKKHKLPGWWAQMVTVGYEQARGRREKHQKPGGYQVGASKTLAVPLSTLFKAWKNSRTRSRWLPEERLVIRKATANKSMRITWPDQTSVDVNFCPKGRGKSQVSVQHGKLPNPKAAARMKAYWKDALARLHSTLQS
jgi:uncharacterized protein YndB with AHSA1/START domain